MSSSAVRKPATMTKSPSTSKPESNIKPRNDEPKGDRLQKILAQAGIASRRKAEEISLEGRGRGKTLPGKDQRSSSRVRPRTDSPRHHDRPWSPGRSSQRPSRPHHHSPSEDRTCPRRRQPLVRTDPYRRPQPPDQKNVRRDRPPRRKDSPHR